MREYYELKPGDVGKPSIRAFRQTWSVQAFIGRVLPGDVGKRVFRVEDGAGGFLQVENDEQRSKRLGGE